MTATLEFTIDKKLLLELLSTAVEYSCTNLGWGQVETYRWYWWYIPDDQGNPTDEVNPDLLPDSVLVRVRDASEDSEMNEDYFVDITLEKLEQATAWALLNYGHLYSSYGFAHNLTTKENQLVDLDYDAIGADVILQKIVFGEVLYG